MSEEKKYDVYAVGNALVDKEFEVNDAFFDSHGIEKGLMTLVEGDEQAKLVELLMAEHGLKKTRRWRLSCQHALCAQPVRRPRLLLLQTRQR